MGTLAMAIGTVGLALALGVVVAVMLRVAWTALTTPVHAAPHDVADALGRLADAERVPFTGKVLTLTAHERHQAMARLYPVSGTARRRARMATCPPKDGA